MLLNLFRAEWKKIMRNRKPLSFLVWIYPMGALTIIALVFLTLFSEETEALAGQSQGGWPAAFTAAWRLLTDFPTNILTRMPFLAFTALVFAGEYQWQTWKNIVPRNRRALLLLAKFVTLALLLLVALGATSVIWGGGWSLAKAAIGVENNPALSAQALADFAVDYLLEVGLAVTSTLILAGYAALVAMRARSVLGGVFVSMGIAVIEPVSLIWLTLIARVLERPGVVRIFRLTPTYNLDNVRAWLLEGHATSIVVDNDLFAEIPPINDSLIVSLALLALWIVGLFLLTAYVFNRQDLAS